MYVHGSIGSQKGGYKIGQTNTISFYSQFDGEGLIVADPYNHSWKICGYKAHSCIHSVNLYCTVLC